MFHLHLPSVFSVDVCGSLIAQAQRRGFEAATVNIHGVYKPMVHVRNNERLEWNDAVLAQRIDEAIVKAAADKFPFIIQDQAYVRLGEHFRMYRYIPGQYFKPHRDGRIESGALASYVTVLIYLNDADEGGTVLMPGGYQDRRSWIKIAPCTGDVLLFEHAIWHEGLPVASGEKYVLRTDLYYRTEAADRIEEST